MKDDAMTLTELCKPRSLRAEIADRNAPIPPPAATTFSYSDIRSPSETALPARRIVRRRSRLRLTLRPAAMTWQRRAARRLLSLPFVAAGGAA